MEIKTKICNKCLLKYDLSFFNTRKDSKDGYRNQCKNCECIERKRIYELDKAKHYKKCREWVALNKDKVKGYNVKYNSTENRRKSSREWNKRNIKKRRTYWNERYRNNIQFNLAIKYRRRIHSSLKKKRLSKSLSTILLLGCSYQDYVIYIQSLFTKGMTWNKVLSGEIQIDHIIPCSKFDLTKQDEMLLCFNYTNLQPLWAKDNLQKAGK